jgi:hypothetical protein
MDIVYEGVASGYRGFRGMEQKSLTGQSESKYLRKNKIIQFYSVPTLTPSSKMKILEYLFLLAFCSAPSLQAIIFTDAVTDTVGGSGHYMDISSVEVTNDAANLYFSLSTVDNATFVGDEFARFMVGIDSVAGGNSAANAWSNLITMPGMDFFGGGFTDSGSGSAINFHSSALGGWPEWQSGDNTWVAYSEAVADPTGVTFSVPLSALGLAVGDTFNFDVYTGWSTGYAMDAVGLSDGTLTQNDWASAYDSGGDVLSYTVVPEPSLYALSLGLVMGFLIFLRRRQKS